jgi:hypothetical protein
VQDETYAEKYSLIHLGSDWRIFDSLMELPPVITSTFPMFSDWHPMKNFANFSSACIFVNPCRSIVFSGENRRLAFLFTELNVDSAIFSVSKGH